MIKLKSCPKRYVQELDKAISPRETVEKIEKILKSFAGEILAGTKRVDTGRLGIPVYFSLYGKDARRFVPARKQMGKGPSPEQAKASALMELVERYSFFSFFSSSHNFALSSWRGAQDKFGKDSLIPLKEILRSVEEDMPEQYAIEILDLIKWNFCSAYDITYEREVYVPADWFKRLNEYNGSSAGNTYEESILQGACELIERHVCAIIDREEIVCPTIDPSSAEDPVLKKLIGCFQDKGIVLYLKDFSLDMGVPTVGALAYDPSTFPHTSEIIFTAGTATSPEKAAIRAITEVAQLAGDFCSASRYEPSGLRKFKDISETAWVRDGEFLPFSSLPDISSPDIYNELKLLTLLLLQKKGYVLYSIDITHPRLGIPANYNFVPGFRFRERSTRPSLGLFVGRILAEEYPPEDALSGIGILDRIYPGAYFIPFFKGIVALRQERIEEALKFFKEALPLQIGDEEQAMVLFYISSSLVRLEKYEEALFFLDEAISLVDDNHIYFNLRGVCYFKLGKYERASRDFLQALNIDKGSAVDLANLGICYLKLGRKEQGLEYLKDSLELDPNLDFARKYLDKEIS